MPEHDVKKTRVYNEGTWGSGGADPVILKLCTRRASWLCAPFALRLGKDLPVHFRWRLAGPPELTLIFVKKKESMLFLPEIEPHSFVVQLLA